MSKTKFNTVEYIDLLKNENPDYDFGISKTGVYRNGEGDIYQVDIEALKMDEEFPSFRMIVGFFDYDEEEPEVFTEDEQKENFKRVAELTINAKIKHLDDLEKERQKELLEQSAKLTKK